jgi:uncharacterized membrane protein
MTRRTASAVVAIASIPGVLFCWHAFARYLTFHNQTFDLAFYARMAWGLARLDFWNPIVNAHFAGLHLAWVMFPLGWLGELVGTVPVLLLTQATAVAAVCWPLSQMGFRRHGTAGALAGALCFMLYPNIGHVSSYEFHPGTLACLPLAFAMDGLDRGSGRALCWSAAGMVACRADLSTVTLMLGVLAMLRGGEIGRAGRWIAGLSALYFLVFVVVLLPVHAPVEGSLQLHFGKWGNSVAGIVLALFTSPGEVAAHLLATNRLIYLPKLLLPLLMLPLLSPRWLLLAAPPFLMNVFSEFPTATELDCHYQTLMVPVLVAATIEGIGRLKRWRAGRWAPWIASGAAAAASVIAGGMPWSLDYRPRQFTEDEGSRHAARIVGAIPDRATIQAPDRLLPHLAERRRLNRLPPPEHGADFLVLDIGHRRRYAHTEDLVRTEEEPGVRDWFARDDHALVMVEGDLVLLQRGRSPREGLGGRYLTGRASETSGRPVTDCLSVLGADLESDRVCLDLKARGPCPRDLVIRLGTEVRSRRVDLLFDGLLSPVHLRRGDRLRSCHPLDPEERRAIEDKGLRVGALRQSGCRPRHADPISVRVLLPR